MDKSLFVKGARITYTIWEVQGICQYTVLLLWGQLTNHLLKITKKINNFKKYNWFWLRNLRLNPSSLNLESRKLGSLCANT